MRHARRGRGQPRHWIRWQPGGAAGVEVHVLERAVRFKELKSEGGPDAVPSGFFCRRLARLARVNGKGPAMRVRNQIYFAAFLLALFAIISIGASAQKEERRERTIDEVRVEAIRRAEVGQYPLIGLDAGDVKEAFESIHTGDKDEWAAGFMHVADRYFNEAKSLEKTDPTKANADYIRAWRIYSFGRWPIPG